MLDIELDTWLFEARLPQDKLGPHLLLIKAIGGSGSKKSCQANMKDLLAGEQMLFTELQSFARSKVIAF